ncbi:MAG: hypothetical protein ACR2ID_02025 [Chthoniobacterales bacterium]
MSKAFTREDNDGPEIPYLPLLASILPQGARNYITATGASELRAELEKLAHEERPSLVATADDPNAKRKLAALFVNGPQVLKDGEHTGATPGQALWGPGTVR